jgi:plastocyanin
MRSWHMMVALSAAIAVIAGGDGSTRAAGPTPSGDVAGRVTILKDGAAKADLSGVAVYLDGVPGGEPVPVTRVMHQKDLSFRPGVLVVTKGSTIEFPNDDKVFHNVFSVSTAARFDLGLYKSGTQRSVTFKKAGVIDVYCNIHPQMVAKIKVLDTRYYAVTGADGAFRIKGVPPGTYPIVAWQAHGDEFRGEATVTAGETASISISLLEGNAPRSHRRKDGTPYGRYK